MKREDFLLSANSKEDLVQMIIEKDQQLSETVEVIKELEGYIDPLRDPKIALKIKIILSQHANPKDNKED